MDDKANKTIVVCGATGRQGGAVSRALLRDGWQVRALTRNPASDKARALANFGAEVAQGDMDDRSSLEPVFEGAYGVFSVQNPMIGGLDAEVRQGQTVASVAKAAGIKHLAYGSAGIGQPTGVGSWDSKLEVEAQMKALGIPLTVLRPMAFMELMTDAGFYPAVSTWHLMPKLMGSARPLPWLTVSDVGVIAAKAFAAPERFIGQDIRLASDVRTLGECRALYSKVMGRAPRRFPMPVWMFRRFVGADLITMWQWLHDEEIDLDTGPTKALHPDALSVEAWLRQQVDAHAAAA